MISEGGALVFSLMISLAIAYLVYYDAKERGMLAGWWFILAFLAWLFIVPLYLIVRSFNPPIRSGKPPQPDQAETSNEIDESAKDVSK